MRSPATPTTVTPPQVAAATPSALVAPLVSTVESPTPSAASADLAPLPRVVPSATPTGTSVARALAPSAKSPPAEAPPGALSQETHLVADARAALRSGDSSRALLLLEEHARRFPGGVLSEERDAERVAALCAAGRGDEARTRAARFSRDYPRSTLGAKVRAACGAR
jgi:hypothetical protein